MRAVPDIFTDVLPVVSSDAFLVGRMGTPSAPQAATNATVISAIVALIPTPLSSVQSACAPDLGPCPRKTCGWRQNYARLGR